MQLSTDIILRPRFQIELEISCKQLIALFSERKKNQGRYGISCLEHHVFIKLPKNEQHFWSPQLHLEISEVSENSCTVHGFFGPNPTVWTMFIFFHVVVGTLFMADMIWLYSNLSLGSSIALQIVIVVSLVATWVFLYLAGRIGKKKGKKEMRELYQFMLDTIGQICFK